MIPKEDPSSKTVNSSHSTSPANCDKTKPRHKEGDVAIELDQFIMKSEKQFDRKSTDLTLQLDNDVKSQRYAATDIGGEVKPQAVDEVFELLVDISQLRLDIVGYS